MFEIRSLKRMGQLQEIAKSEGMSVSGTKFLSTFQGSDVRIGGIRRARTHLQ